MSQTRLHGVLRRAVQDLSAAGARFALVGALAVSTRAEPRFTRHLDLAVAVADDKEAERIAGFLRGRGYEIRAIVEQEATGRLATARLPGRLPEGSSSTSSSHPRGSSRRSSPARSRSMCFRGSRSRWRPGPTSSP
jgi:hypothetical protein